MLFRSSTFGLAAALLIASPAAHAFDLSPAGSFGGFATAVTTDNSGDSTVSDGSNTFVNPNNEDVKQALEESKENFDPISPN